MRFVTFNIKHAVGDPLDADVLALQVVDAGVARSGSVDQAAAWAERTGMHAVFGPTCRLGPDGRYGNALLTRSQARDVELLPLPRRDGNEPRGAILASVDGVSVAATHLSIHEDESALQLRALLDALAARPRPWVLLGDLNRPPELVAGALAHLGLDLLDPSEPTFPARRPRRRIDHIAVAGAGEWRVERVEVLPRQRVSDHRPVAAELTRPLPSWPGR
jgi:endonuclease/exonuclease/phosphatase family metal-dependent hydrolase